jgi:hypothetical protein
LTLGNQDGGDVGGGGGVATGGDALDVLRLPAVFGEGEGSSWLELEGVVCTELDVLALGEVAAFEAEGAA